MHNLRSWQEGQAVSGEQDFPRDPPSGREHGFAGIRRHNMQESGTGTIAAARFQLAGRKVAF
ncbi:MAG: hypothetical protein IH604_01325 [Burkholderiales bacterium]|nr:hypothetical protein [Burkholderiales bacterium]